MEITKEKLKELLVDSEYISLEEFQRAVEKSQKEGMSIKDYLVDQGLISDENMGKIIAEEYNYLFINLRKEKVPEKILKIVPEVVAKNQKIIVFDRDKEGLKVAMNDPDNYKIIKWLEKKTGEKVRVYYTTKKSIADTLHAYRKGLKEEFSDIIKSQVDKAKKLKVKAEDIPIIRIVNTLIEYAYENGSSDIHIEPLEEKTQVRFRIDGLLHEVLTLPKDIHNLVVTRIKVLSKLRTDEQSTAQDGKFQVKLNPFSIEGGEEKFDIRVSVVPITEGEKVVMRLLSQKARQFSLKDLGFSTKDLEKINGVIKKPYGMILSTGPTGSGKTTTLYAVLKMLNRPEINITTIEDPVEYDVERVSQIQVNNKTGLTFAKGLRSIVRQDPDVIMVGEIRDNETANIAVNSAMTGHLVLSTMHANTAATNLIRLTDMGIEPFLVASSVNIVIGQRLVRKICEKCRYSYEVTKKELKNMGFSNKVINKILDNKESKRVYKGKGCSVCGQTGYRGRIGIFEILEITDEIKTLIMNRSNSENIQDMAIKNGMNIMMDNGIKKIINGITTIEEILRVTKE